jgi:hypothetical protein
MIEQHNHHCLLTFMGSNWRIWRVRKHLIDVVHPFVHPSLDEDVHVTIDTADVDFEAYATAVAAWESARERA